MFHIMETTPGKNLYEDRCTSSVKAKNICLKIEIKINYFDLIIRFKLRLKIERYCYFTNHFN